MKRISLYTIALAIILLYTMPAHALEIEGGVSGSYSLVNSSTAEVSVSDAFGDVAWQATYNRSDVNGVAYADDYSISGGYDPPLTKDVYAWGFGMRTVDRISGVNQSEIGGGLKLYMYKTDAGKASLSVGLIRHTVSDIDDVMRVSYRVKASYDSGGAVVFYQPSIKGDSHVIRGSIHTDYGTDERGIRASVDYDYNSDTPELESWTPALKFYYKIGG